MTDYEAPAVDELGDVAQLTEGFQHSGHGDHDKDWGDKDWGGGHGGGWGWWG